MLYTSLGFKKPELTDSADIRVAVGDNMDLLDAAISSKANSASPTLTGTPTAPTAAVSTNTTQIATTAFVKSQIVKGTGTIPTSGWVANTGDYAYKLNYTISGVTATDIVNIVLDKDDIDYAGDIELCPTNESYAGGVTLFAQSIPTSTLSFSYMVVK